MNLVCKLFRFLLNIFEQVVNVAASAISAVGNAVVDVLSDLVESTADALGFGNIGTFAKWLLVGGLIYGVYVITRDDDEEDSKPGIVDALASTTPN